MNLESESRQSPERSLRNVLREAVNVVIEKLFATPDLNKMTDKRICDAKVVIPDGDELQTKKAEVTLGNLTDKEGNLIGIFLLGIQQEKGGDDRIFVCITKQEDRIPVLYFRLGLTKFMAGLPGRTLHFWQVPNVNGELQVTELVDPRVQLWKITTETLPEDIRESIREGSIDIQAVIKAADKGGYRIYISNQGSWKRGPLPVPGWIDA